MLGLLFAVLFGIVSPASFYAQTIETIIGNIPLTQNPDARQIPFVIPRGLALDTTTATLYVSDDGSAAVRRISLATSQSAVLVGGGKSIDDLIPIAGRAANINFATGLALDHAGNLFIADDAHHRIRKLTPDGQVTTVVGNGTPGFSGDGGPATRAQLNLPKSVAFDASDNLYITDSLNGAIRRVDRLTGEISTIAGGPGNTAQGDVVPALRARLAQPYAITLNAAGELFITDNADHVVYRLDPRTGLLRKIAGVFATPGTSGDRGLAFYAQLQQPRGIAVAANGDVYIGMVGQIRKINAATGFISTVLGNLTGLLPLVEGNRGDLVYVPGNVEQMVLDEAGGMLYAAIAGSNVIGQVNLRNGEFNIRAGDPSVVGDGGSAQQAALAQPNKLAVAADGTLYLADTFHHRIRRIQPGAGGVGTGTVSTVVGNGLLSLAPSATGPASSSISFPRAVAVDPAGGLYFTTGQSMIRRLDPNGSLRTIAGLARPGFNGDGVLATSLRLNDPWGMTLDAAGNLYVADAGNNRIRKIFPGGSMTTIAGTGVAGADGLGNVGKAAQLNFPIDVRLDPRGEFLYIADQGNRRVVKLNLATGILSFVFGPTNCRGIAFDAAGRMILTETNRIYRIDPQTGASEVIAGDGVAGYAGDGGLATLSRVSGVLGVVLDAAGNILFADSTNSRVRRIAALPDPARLTLAPSQLRFSASQGGAAPADQTIEISTANQVRTGWSVSVRTQSGGNWLALRTNAGATPAVIQAGVNPSGLSVGEYSGTITLSAPGAANSPLTLPVQFTITPPQPPVLEVGPQLLTFQGIVGSADPAAKSFNIANRAGGTMDWTVLPLTNSGGNWLTASPTNGRGAAVVSLAPRTTGLRAGLYEASVRITNVQTGRVEIVTVSMQLDDPSPAMQLSQTGVVFTSSPGSTNVAPETFRVLNSGSGVLNWRARITPLSGGAWLDTDVEAGATNGGEAATITLQPGSQADGVNLAPGIYDALVEISAEGARNSPQVLLARLRILDPESPPVPTVRPGSLVLSAQAGSTLPQSGRATITSSGGTGLTYQSAVRTTDGGDWLRVSPGSGPLFGSADLANLTVEARAEQLPAGFYSGQVSLAFSNGTTQEIGVLFVVTPVPVVSQNGAGRKDGATLGLPGSAICEPVSQRPWVLSLTNNVATPTAWPMGIRAAVVDNCGNLVSRSSVIAVIASGATTDRVAMQAIGEGQYAANYTMDRADNYLISVTASGSGLLAGTSDPVSANSATLPPSQLTPGVNSIGAADGASGRQFTSLAPGQIISVTGSALAAAPSDAPTLPLPTELGGVKVSLGGRSLPLYSSGPEAVNAQVPFELAPGSDLPLVIIARGNASPPQMVRIGRTSPGLFTQNQTGQGLGMVSDLQGRANSPANPARRGEEVIAFGTGFGVTVPPVASGVASPATPPALIATPVRVLVGGEPAEVVFAGLAPGFVGLYQINFRVPSSAPTGDAVELYIEQDNNTSNRVVIAVQ